MRRLPRTRPSRPLARRVPKTCRWPASCPRKAIWVNANARNTAVTSCHQESPSRKKAVQPAVSSTAVEALLAA
jgi:hypothetical protein